MKEADDDLFSFENLREKIYKSIEVNVLQMESESQELIQLSLQLSNIDLKIKAARKAQEKFER
jgi:tRNA threonylcarbamoyladenosine modification (KEOPS) complex  Pcc1 subunit